VSEFPPCSIEHPESGAVFGRLSKGMKIVFDSDNLRPCACGGPSLTVEFFDGGDWRISCCHCGYYWPKPVPKFNLTAAD
jgi:hypothetical protein